MRSIAEEKLILCCSIGIKLDGGSPPSSGSAIWRNELVPLPGDPLRLLTSRLLSLPEKFVFGRFMIKLGKVDCAALPY